MSLLKIEQRVSINIVCKNVIMKANILTSLAKTVLFLRSQNATVFRLEFHIASKQI